MVRQTKYGLVKAVCPECKSDKFTVIGTRWRKKVKWSKEPGERIKVLKIQCKDCGRVHSQDLE